MADKRRFIVQGNENSFERIKSLSEQFAKVAVVLDKQNKIIVEGEPTGYYKRQLSKLHAGVYEDRPYNDDPYHPYFGFC